VGASGSWKVFKEQISLELAILKSLARLEQAGKRVRLVREPLLLGALWATFALPLEGSEKPAGQIVLQSGMPRDLESESRRSTGTAWSPIEGFLGWNRCTRSL